MCVTKLKCSHTAQCKLTQGLAAYSCAPTSQKKRRSILFTLKATVELHFSGFGAKEIKTWMLKVGTHTLEKLLHATDNKMGKHHWWDYRLILCPYCPSLNKRKLLYLPTKAFGVQRALPMINQVKLTAETVFFSQLICNCLNHIPVHSSLSLWGCVALYVFSNVRNTHTRSFWANIVLYRNVFTIKSFTILPQQMAKSICVTHEMTLAIKCDRGSLQLLPFPPWACHQC